jgi:hypothetical protein
MRPIYLGVRLFCGAGGEAKHFGKIEDEVICLLVSVLYIYKSEFTDLTAQ